MKCHGVHIPYVISLELVHISMLNDPCTHAHTNVMHAYQQKNCYYTTLLDYYKAAHAKPGSISSTDVCISAVLKQEFSHSSV